MIEGTQLQNSGIVFSFLKNTDNELLCEMCSLCNGLTTRNLSEDGAYKLQKAIFNHYWYQV